MTFDDDGRRLNHLLSAGRETEWIELKENDEDPNAIGEYLSALSNAAALHDQPRAYVVWGVEDGTLNRVGTTFRPRLAKVGNEELESWLCHNLSPRIDFRIHEWDDEGRRFVIFEIPPAVHTPVRFRNEAWIRVGTYKKRLREYPEKEKALWGRLSQLPFEEGIALPGVDAEEALVLLDYPGYFELTGQRLPVGVTPVLERLVTEGLLRRAGTDRFDVTNLGAILFARNLEAVRLPRKAVRVVVYGGANRISTLREHQSSRGYAVGFQALVDYVGSQLPQNEHLRAALRTEHRMYPEVAVRELVANALIHQDFAMTGSGPMIEIFTDRVEITNPGVPLIETQRFLDAPPRSRNDRLAALMRRMAICEERGSGIDKVVFHVELYQLPAPDFRVTEGHTQAFLFGPRPFAAMSRDDRIRACYQHAALLWVSNSQMTNATLRKRFAIADRNYAMASRVIGETIEAGLIKPFDPTNRSKKHARYVPFWA